MAKDMGTYLPREGKFSQHMSESKPQIGESSRQTEKTLISGQDLLDPQEIQGMRDSGQGRARQGL